MSKDGMHYKPGDKIFAEMKGYPLWPARIEESESATGEEDEEHAVEAVEEKEEEEVETAEPEEVAEEPEDEEEEPKPKAQKRRRASSSGAPTAKRARKSSKSSASAKEESSDEEEDFDVGTPPPSNGSKDEGMLPSSHGTDESQHLQEDSGSCGQDANRNDYERWIDDDDSQDDSREDSSCSVQQTGQRCATNAPECGTDTNIDPTNSVLNDYPWNLSPPPRTHTMTHTRSYSCWFVCIHEDQHIRKSEHSHLHFHSPTHTHTRTHTHTYILPCHDCGSFCPELFLSPPPLSNLFPQELLRSPLPSPYGFTPAPVPPVLPAAAIPHSHLWFTPLATPPNPPPFPLFPPCSNLPVPTLLNML